MKKNNLAVIILSVIVAGCTQSNYQQRSPAQAARDMSISTVNTAFSKQIVCNDNLREGKLIIGDGSFNPALKDAAKIVDQEVFVRSENSPNKLELMSSTAKISQKQIKAVLDLYTAAGYCRNILRESLKDYPALLAAVNNRYGENDVIYSKLISKKITIGEANQELAQAFTRYRTEYTAAINNLNNQYNNQINQEIQAAQAEEMQRRALASQYLMNQQAINAQQRMNQQNQMNNRLPVQTNCYKIGNSMNCTSQ